MPARGLIRPVLTGISYPNEERQFDLSKSAHEFVRTIEIWNADRIKLIMTILKECLREVDPHKVAVLLIGSDGKREKGPYSPLEFVILSKDQAQAEYASSLIKKHSTTDISFDVDPEAQCLPDVDHDIEIKLITDNPETQQPLSGHYGNVRNSWPDRVLASQIVYGSPKIQEEAQAMVLKEYANITQVRERMRRTKKYFEKVSRTGTSNVKGNEVEHFNQRTGQLRFNPSEYARGLKYGPIRLVQLCLTLYQLEQQIPSVDPHIITRINQLLTGQCDLEPTINSYAESLRSYHLQQLFWSNGHTEAAEYHIDPLQLAQLLSASLKLETLIASQNTD